MDVRTMVENLLLFLKEYLGFLESDIDFFDADADAEQLFNVRCLANSLERIHKRHSGASTSVVLLNDELRDLDEVAELIKWLNDPCESGTGDMYVYRPDDNLTQPRLMKKVSTLFFRSALDTVYQEVFCLPYVDLHHDGDDLAKLIAVLDDDEVPSREILEAGVNEARQIIASVFSLEDEFSEAAAEFAEQFNGAENDDDEDEADTEWEPDEITFSPDADREFVPDSCCEADSDYDEEDFSQDREQIEVGEDDFDDMDDFFVDKIFARMVSDFDVTASFYRQYAFTP